MDTRLFRLLGCGFAIGAMLSVSGCRSQPSETTPPAKLVSASVKSGTPVPLMLLTNLAAGTTDVGSKVLFMAAEDVKDAGGHVLIKCGTAVEGEVTASRSEGMLSGIMNQPARLAVKLGSVKAADGTPIAVLAEPKAKPDEPIQFSRENTASAGIAAELDKMADGAQKDTLKNLSEGLNDYLATGDPSKIEASADVKAALDKLLQAPDLHDAKKALDPGSQGKSSLSTLSKTLERLHGGGALSLSASEALLAVSALEELGRLAGSAEKSLSRIFRGRTLRAHVGTRLTAYCAEDTKITVPEVP